MTQHQEAVAYQGAKIVGIWSVIGITSWAEAASFLAFVLSFLALMEYLYKKLIRPILVHYGYVAPRKRKQSEEQGDE